MDNNTTANRGKRLTSNTVLLGIGTFLTKGIALIMVVFYSKWLTTADFGMYDLLATYLSLFIPVATLSCGEAVFRFLLEKETIIDKRRIISTAVAIALGGIGVFVVVMFLFAKSLFQSYFIDFVILFLVETVFELCQHCARGLHRIKYYTIASIINSVSVAIAASILIYVCHLQIRGLLIAHIVGYAFGSLFVIVSLRLYELLRLKAISANEAKGIVKYSAPLIPNSIAWWIANSSDRTLINVYLGSDFNGIYAMANKVPSLCVTLFNVFHLSWQESVSDSLREDKNPTEYFNAIFARLAPTVFSIACCVLAINFYLFEYVFDPKYISAYYHVSILTTATLFSFMGQFIGGIFIGLKRTSVNGLTTLMAAMINIIVDFALIRKIGLFAASVSTLVAYLFLFSIRFIIVRKTYILKFSRQSAIYFFVFLWFCYAQYLNIPVLHHINFIFAGCLFVFTNKSFFTIFVKKLQKRGKKERN